MPKKKKTECIEPPELPVNQSWYAYVAWAAMNHTIKFIAVILVFGFLIWLILNLSFSVTTKQGIEIKADPVELKRGEK